MMSRKHWTSTGKTMVKENVIRQLVRSLLAEGQCEKHLCMNGDLVPIESQECYDDVCMRIADAQATRNMCSMQSDSRDHYNGILKVLRRKQRKARKYVDSLTNQE